MRVFVVLSLLSTSFLLAKAQDECFQCIETAMGAAKCGDGASTCDCSSGTFKDSVNNCIKTKCGPEAGALGLDGLVDELCSASAEHEAPGASLTSAPAQTATDAAVTSTTDGPVIDIGPPGPIHNHTESSASVTAVTGAPSTMSLPTSTTSLTTTPTTSRSTSTSSATESASTATASSSGRPSFIPLPVEFTLATEALVAGVLTGLLLPLF